jgi:hypothetical protein
LWFWGILGGGTVSRFCTLFALTLVAADAPAWLAVLVFAAHIPGTSCCSWASGVALDDRR